MCGIIGYVGEKDAEKIVLEGLHALEYRGYDSAGLAVRGERGNIVTLRCAGRVSQLEKKANAQFLSGHEGIGHTRWATHGAPTEENAHPHRSASLCLVHNGIIDNCFPLRRALEDEGYFFRSETDTECLAHLMDRAHRKTHDPAKAIYTACDEVRGAYAVAVMFNDRPGEIWAIHHDSPLILAKAPDGCLLASDIPALLPHTRHIVRPPEDTVIRITAERMDYIARDGGVTPAVTEYFDAEVGTAGKDGYEHFMLKEIYEQPDVIRHTALRRMGADGLPDFSADGIEKSLWESVSAIEIVACGSATHAGLLGRTLIETLAGVPVSVNTASEYRYDPPAVLTPPLLIPISQSGETADTLAALRLARKRGQKSAAIVNVVGSAVAREADYVMYTGAGPEIAVATTKGYTSQVVLLAMIGIDLALSRGKIDAETARTLCRSLTVDLPRAVREILARWDEIRALAQVLRDADDVYFIGRGQDACAGVEASLKLKEISYIHSESYPAGELKHGTLSLIEPGTPVIALATGERYFDKMAGNIREVRARGGYVILLCTESFPDAPLLSDRMFCLPSFGGLAAALLPVIVSQLLAYETALLRGCDVDHPRNLAKSVTVE